MSVRRHVRTASQFVRRVDTVLLYAGCFFYLWWVVDARLIFHSLGVLRPYAPFDFNVGWPFFWEQVPHAGGFVRYAANLATQLYQYGWLGSLLLTGLALVMCWSVDHLFHLTGRPRGRVLRYVPALLVLVLCGGYAHALGPLLALVLAMLAFAAYSLFARQARSQLAGVVMVIATSTFLYLVVGNASLLFCLLVLIYELLVRRRGLMAAVVLVSAMVTLGWITLRTPEVESWQVVFRSLLDDPGIPQSGQPIVWLLYSFFPLVLSGLAVLHAWQVHRQTQRQPQQRRRKQAERTATDSSGTLPGLWKRINEGAIPFVAVLLAGGFLLWYSWDSQLKVVLQLDYWAQRSDWAKVLQAADQMPYGVYNIRCNRNIMLALFHEGQLGDRMFQYPQTPMADFYSLPNQQKNPHDYYQESRMFLELGHVNLAEHGACESLEAIGELPKLLEHIVTINVVKDRPAAARVFLMVLRSKLLCRRRADELLQQLARDPEWNDNARVRKIRQSVVQRDDVSTNVNVEDSLVALLERNPQNRMAFEFLMTHYLCTARPDQVVANLDRLADFGYETLPRHYQEAIVVDSLQRTGQMPADDRRVSPEVLQAGEEFSDIVASSRSPEEAAFNAAVAGLGGTYFYYYKFGVSGL